MSPALCSVRGVDYRVEASEWVVAYLGQPIGKIRRTRRGHLAKLFDEDLGLFRNGDAAAEAVWRRYVEQSAARHDRASVTHGGADRHRQR